MSINLIPVHKHKFFFSYAQNKKVDGFFIMQKGKVFPIPKDSYCFFKCKECNCDLYPNKADEKIFQVQKGQNEDINFFFKKDNDSKVLNVKYYKLFLDDNNGQSDNIYIGSKKEIEDVELEFIQLMEKNILDSEDAIKKNTENKVIKNYENIIKRLRKDNEEIKANNNFLKKENYQLKDKFLNKIKIYDNKENNFNKMEEYDIILDIDSMVNLSSEGWNVKYPKGKEEYERKMKMETIIAGVIGNRNKGKSFILQKLSGYDIPQGFSVVTEGLSVKYGEETDHCIAILDSAGKETPLLNPKKEIDIYNEKTKILESIKKEPKSEDDGNFNKQKIYEKCLRDKLITETFIQRFIIDISHILILVVGNINLNEQKLLENVKSSLKNDQFLYVIHNLVEMHSNDQVNDYINNQLKNLFGIKLKERNFQNNKGDYHQVYYVEEENEKVTHLIYVNEYSTIADYYNIPTIQFLKNKNQAEQRRTKFSVIEACKKYLIEIGDQYIEEKIELDNFENENNDKIKLKNSSKISLKKVFIDEIGKTQTNTLDQPRYSYYTEDNGKILVIDIEVPGEGADLKTKVEKDGTYYNFYFIGTKPCDQLVINQKHTVHSQLKNKIDIKFNFYISIKDITLGTNEKGKLNYFEKTNKYGIFKFKYHLNDGDSGDFE